jgi:uncharacterized protein YbjT (DUF2867 family)
VWAVSTTDRVVVLVPQPPLLQLAAPDVPVVSADGLLTRLVAALAVNGKTSVIAGPAAMSSEPKLRATFFDDFTWWDFLSCYRMN